MFHNDTAMRREKVRAGGGGVGAGGEETWKAKGEKGKINTTSTLFPWHGKERGSIVGGMMIYVRGGRAVRVRRGRRCAPIMINAPPLLSWRQPSSTLSVYPHTHHHMPPLSFTTTTFSPLLSSSSSSSSSSSTLWNRIFPSFSRMRWPNLLPNML